MSNGEVAKRNKVEAEAKVEAQSDAEGNVDLDIPKIVERIVSQYPDDAQLAIDIALLVAVISHHAHYAATHRAEIGVEEHRHNEAMGKLQRGRKDGTRE